MASCCQGQKPKTVAEKLRLHLSQCDKDLDVTFLVGPQNVKMRAVRLILVASSPVFKQLFEEKWDQAVSKAAHEEGIPLPDVDPETFHIFLQNYVFVGQIESRKHGINAKNLLLLWDDVSATKLDMLDLTVKDGFNLLELCKNYEMMELWTNLETLNMTFFRKLPEYVETDRFLGLPRNILKQILQHEFQAPDEITMFEKVIKWAEFQCAQQNIEKNGANIRDVLGDCLPLIRFPIMGMNDFGNRVCPTNVLTAEEKLKLFEFIVLPQDKRCSFDASSLGFNTSLRGAKKVRKNVPANQLSVPDVGMARADPAVPESIRVQTEDSASDSDSGPDSSELECGIDDDCGINVQNLRQIVDNYGWDSDDDPDYDPDTDPLTYFSDNSNSDVDDVYDSEIVTDSDDEKDDCK